MRYSRGVTPAGLDDHYARLGVSRTASCAELRRAYRLLALRWHPDRAGPGSTELFQRISEAYQVLSHPPSRAFYDGKLRDQGGHGEPTARSPAAARGKGDHRGPGGRVTWRIPTPGGGTGPRLDRLSGSLEDLLARAAARRREDGAIELLLQAAEAASGGVAAIEAPLPVTCPTCGGVAAHHRVWCRRCQYAGQVVDHVTILVDIPAGAVDGASFAFEVDPTGMLPAQRVRLRVG
jgi:molecular chaperone DnaJ